MATTQKNTPEKQTYDEKKQAEKDQNKQDISLYNKAIHENQWDICGNIVDVVRKWMCEDMISAKKAIELNDKSHCTQIKDPTIRVQCNDRISQKLAEEKWQKSLCDIITETGSQLYCRENIDEKLLQIALSDQTTTKEFCASLEIKFQEVCETSLAREIMQNNYNTAIKSGNTEDCKAIQTESERTLCLDSLTLRKAITGSDMSLCETIIQDEKRAYCKKTLTKNTETQRFKEYISTNNLSGCSSLTDVAFKNKCTDTVIFSLVRTNKDSKLCEKITNTGMLANCRKIAE
jgi:hypothetical protein